ncbi:MAG: FtsW/RodA/SpoVE family cell cycle protein, partial [bacterium]|nr:FtsW/RodA/SpoVE family cell cycle protein [Candidatus Limimorpha equi]
MNGINKILKGDKVIWILALLLGIISLVVVYSAASALVVRNYDGNTGRMLMKHAGTLFLGYLMMFIAYKINYQHYSTIFKFVLWLCVPLLLYTMIFGNNLNQASRTINVFGFSFQPSEWAKIALITYTARELVVLEDKIHDLRTVLTKIAIPILLITGLIFTENLSTAVILLTACIVLLIVGRVKFMHILAIGGLGIILLGCYIAYDSAKTSVSNSKAEKELTELVSEDATVSLEFTPKQSRVQTWINRINTMFEDDEEAFDPFDDHHYQQTYAKIAVASSSFFGKGPGKSEQRNFLPHPYSDFIFAIIVEEYGI